VREGYGPWIDLEVRSRDREALLVDFANELVGRGEAENRAYDQVTDIVIDDHAAALRARARGRAVSLWRSPLKAATYHAASLRPEGQGWHAQLVFDV
jgi:SHS2 domain-containing protein